ncbi:adaptin N terminal region-domain-containing protein [Phyllosticta citrichinensis]
MKDNSELPPLQCRQILASVARLILSGEKIGNQDVTYLLNGVMDLFKHKEDSELRQIVHWIIKEMYQLPELTRNTYHSLFYASVSTDAKGDEGKNNPLKIVRPNAIRAYCRVFDPSTVENFSKAIDPLIVNPEFSVQSAALVSLYHTLPLGLSHIQGLEKQIQEVPQKIQELFKKQKEPFQEKIQEVPKKFKKAFEEQKDARLSAWPEYHALGLDYRIRRAPEMLAKDYIESSDRDSREIRKLQGAASKIFFARFAAEMAEKSNYRQGAIDFLNEQLDKPTVTGDKETFLERSMVALEAARNICQIEHIDSSSVIKAVKILVEMANNSHQVVQFAAMRTLCSIASTYPDAVRQHNESIRKQMTNSNKDIGSFAITILRKTADEADVDSFIEKFKDPMKIETNDFKFVIVEAATAFCLKFPAKKNALAGFLSNHLKEHPSSEVKRAVIEGMFDLVKSIPDIKKDVLTQLCEFIEDSENPNLTIRVLHFIGTEGPTVDHATPYIRYIYNRLVLENALVRAAAVTALSKFGVGQKEPELKRSVHVLLSRSLDDEDDEVRDRAALSLRLMDGEDEKSRELVRNDSMYSLAEFEDRLALYVSTEDRSIFNEPFDLSLVPIVSRDKALSETRTKKLLGSTTPKPPSASKSAGRKGVDDFALFNAAAQKKYMQEMHQVPEMAEYGRLLKSSPVIQLTQPKEEYVVSVIKHIFNEHVVFQYNITNTPSQNPNTLVTAYNVDIDVDLSTQSYLKADFSTPVEELGPDQTCTVYIGFRKTEGAQSSIPEALRFKSKMTYRTNEDSGEYELDSTWLIGADFVVPAFAGSFDNVWEQFPRKEYSGSPFTLSASNLKDAALEIITAFSLQPLDNTDEFDAVRHHDLKLYGKTLNGGKVAMIVTILADQTHQISGQIKAKSEEEGIDKLLAESCPKALRED